MTRHYLALDLGAESGRAMLARLDDHQLALTELHRFPNQPIELPTGLYWDTPRLFFEICEGVRATAQAVESPDGIAIDTWGVDFALLDATGELLHLPRHYRDGRCQKAMPRVLERLGPDRIYAQTGIQFMGINSLYQLAAYQDAQPDLLGRTGKLLFMPDLFNFFLTGAFAAERTIASTSQFYNPVTQQFATEMLRDLKIPSNFLPKLVDPGCELGPVLPYIADYCRLRRECLVFTTGSHDTASAVAAVPATSDDDRWCYISSGTWSLMGVELRLPVITEAAREANFTNEIGVDGTVRFLKNIPGLWILQECRRAWAREGNAYGYEELVAMAAEAPHCETVIDLDQFLQPGDHPRRIANFCRKTGQQVPQNPSAIARTVLYSLAVRYSEILAQLERLTLRSIDTIYIVGGGSRNRLLNQLAANATGRRVVAGPAEATAAGNALTQALGSGAIASLGELREIVQRSFTPEEFSPAQR